MQGAVPKGTGGEQEPLLVAAGLLGSQKGTVPTASNGQAGPGHRRGKNRGKA